MPDDFLGAVSGPAPQRGVGVVAPFDLAMDRELWRWVPDEVTLYLTRTAFVPVPMTVEMASLISDEAAVHSATRDLLSPEPEVVAYACASGSFVDGAAGERNLVTVMREAGAPAAVTTSGALVQALHALGTRRIAIATPYVENVTERLVGFLGEHDIEVVTSVGLGLLGQIWKVNYRQVVDIVRSADRPEADAMFISCTNLPTYDIIGPLEQELGKPVLTANQVTMWGALHAIGMPAVAPQQRLVQALDESAA
ncbi:MAG: Asp/Glu racemase [Saccharopolyspora sp.]|uniref:maleate cis-trans isomerase family protein n=1 Tax=Saccharopolyspora TaxID=1835 RepID=UPI00190B14CB|nr:MULTISPECIES: Asp/Glu racemase [unclassified Saccharopolyspora]MBK0869814.1 Asp/Glu racemase [Saccharopolyspora sp. HNM0986]MBQ6642469.1 Asp/Glu racemase [Saccharopolyspora sp.]